MQDQWDRPHVPHNQSPEGTKAQSVLCRAARPHTLVLAPRLCLSEEERGLELELGGESGGQRRPYPGPVAFAGHARAGVFAVIHIHEHRPRFCLRNKQEAVFQDAFLSLS